MGIEPIQPAALPAKPVITPPAPPPAPVLDQKLWFGDANRPPDSWDPKSKPLPVTGNQITTYVEVLDYYVALGKAIRATRPNVADFVYIAGWNIDLKAYLDPVGTTPRQTLEDVLKTVAKSGVEVRVLMPAQPHDGQDGNLAGFGALGGGGFLDPFFKFFGTHHQKFVVVRCGEGHIGFCGGCDLDNARLGREGVPSGAPQPLSNPQMSAPWHDAQVQVRGPAVADLWNSFCQRFNDIRNVYIFGYPLTAKVITGISPLTIRLPDAAAAKAQAPGLDVQVVRTYPNKNKKLTGDNLIVFPKQAGYSFAPQGEMGVYGLLVNALNKTTNTIYLEDQYLVNTVAMDKNPPITDAIRKAIERDSFQKMVILVAGTGTVQGELCQAGTRRADFMAQLGPQAAKKVSTYIYRGDFNSPYWLHSKLWIFDDQFVVIGSANCNRRGYSYDSELDIGIADPNKTTGGNYFAKRFRMDLWLKHLNALPLAAGPGAKGTFTDKDVSDFVAAAPLWDQAKLLMKIDFQVNPPPDIPAATLIRQKFPAAVTAFAAMSSRDSDWDIVDPSGA